MRKNAITLALIFVFLIITIGNIIRIEPNIAGLNYDDGIYLSLAKALAEGKGYRAIYQIGTPIHVLYLPFYPYALSLIWRIYPYFPENILFLKSASIFAFLGLLIFAFLFLKQFPIKRHFVYPAMILLASCVSVYRYSNYVNADIFYGLWLFLFLYYFYYKIKIRERLYPLYFLSVILITSVFLFYTRVTGIAFCLSWIVYFLFKRNFKYLFIYSGIIVIVTLPWFFYILKDIESSYLGFILDKDNYFHLGLNRIFPIIFENLRVITIRSIPMYIFPTAYSKFVITKFATGNFIFIRNIFCLIISTLTIYGFICIFQKERFIFSYVICYLGLMLIWNWEPNRYLLSLAPFIIISFLYGLFRLIDRIGPLLPFEKYKFKLPQYAFLAVFFIILTGNFIRSSDLFDYSNISLIRKNPHPHQAVFDWIKNNTEEHDRIATVIDPMYYLYTGRKTINYLDITYSPKSTEQLKEMLDLNHVSYIVQTPYLLYDDKPVDIGYRKIAELNKDYPFLLMEVFRDTHSGVTIYKIRR